MSTAIEERLAAALEARADLVQTEHLTPSALPGVRPDRDTGGSGGQPDPADRARGGWRRWTAYAAVAAAALAALVLPVWLAEGPEREPEPAEEPAPPPEGWVGGVGGTGPGADLPGMRVSADVDGDGAPDTVWLRSREDYARPGPVRVEVLLSSAPDAVRWTVLRSDAVMAQLEGAPGAGALGVEVDGDAGTELLVLLQPDAEGDGRLAVVDLLDGRLVEADLAADLEAGAVPAGPGVDAQDRSLGFGFVGGELVTTRTVESARGDLRQRRVDAWTWRLAPGDPGERPVVVAAPRGELCRDFVDGLLGECVPGTDRPTGEGGPVVGGENPSDVVPDFHPEARWHSGPGQVLAFTSDSGSGTARVGGTAEEWLLEVELDGSAYAAGLGPGERPPVLVAATVASEAAPGFAVVRGAGDATAWSVWTVRGGELVEVEVLADEVPLGDGVRGSGGRAESYSTHLSVSGLLSTRVTDPADGGSEVAQVWTWSLDEGPALVSTPAGCFDFPADGSAPTFATRC